MSLWRRRRRQLRNEDYIWQFQFPERIEERCRHHHPDLTHEDWKLIEQGLREWFLCCAWRDGEVLGMPSRLVDEAWHEFILDSRAYTEFCQEPSASTSTTPRRSRCRRRWQARSTRPRGPGTGPAAKAGESRSSGGSTR